MKKTKFTESQIVKAIKEAENGRSVSEISRIPAVISSFLPHGSLLSQLGGGKRIMEISGKPSFEAGLFATLLS